MFQFFPYGSTRIVLSGQKIYKEYWLPSLSDLCNPRFSLIGRAFSTSLILWSRGDTSWQAVQEPCSFQQRSYVIATHVVAVGTERWNSELKRPKSPFVDPIAGAGGNFTSLLTSFVIHVTSSTPIFNRS